MAEPAKIFSLIPLVMAEVGAIGKNGVNKDQNYKFRSIDDVYNALQPVLAKHQVFFIPEVIEAAEVRGVGKSGNGVHARLRVRYKIYAPDGSHIEAMVQGEGLDYSDKATNKALSAAFKYMLIQIFCIAVEGQVDADTDSPEQLTIVQEKKPETSKKGQVKNHAPQASCDFKIPEGKFKGKFVSKVRKEELKEYVENILQAMEQSGKQPPPWFVELRKVSGT